MIKLRAKRRDNFHDIEDCEIIKEQLTDAGYRTTLEDINVAWSAYSEYMCASWIIPYKKASDNVAVILTYMEEIKE